GVITAMAPSLVSMRKSALRVDFAGPWQLKQLSERIGRMSRLNSTFFGCAVAARGQSKTTKNARGRIMASTNGAATAKATVGGFLIGYSTGRADATFRIGQQMPAFHFAFFAFSLPHTGSNETK